MGAIITALLAGFGLVQIAPSLGSLASQAAQNKACEQMARAMKEMEKIRKERK